MSILHSLIFHWMNCWKKIFVLLFSPDELSAKDVHVTFFRRMNCWKKIFMLLFSLDELSSQDVHVTFFHRMNCRWKMSFLHFFHRINCRRKMSMLHFFHWMSRSRLQQLTTEFAEPHLAGWTRGLRQCVRPRTKEIKSGYFFSPACAICLRKSQTLTLLVSKKA
jgi:hypothetical protein